MRKPWEFSMGIHGNVFIKTNCLFIGQGYLCGKAEICQTPRKLRKHQQEAPGGSVRWVSAFSLGHNLKVLGWSPTSGSLLSRKSASLSLSLPLPLHRKAPTRNWMRVGVKWKKRRSQRSCCEEKAPMKINYKHLSMWWCCRHGLVQNMDSRARGPGCRFCFRTH